MSARFHPLDRHDSARAYYWLAILFTFALGTAVGDLVAERLSLGYGLSGVIFAGIIAAGPIAHFRFHLNPVLAFWIAYVLTHPLGASLGDYMSQPRADGGLGLGTTGTSLVFLTLILALVVYLSVTRVDALENADRAVARRVSTPSDTAEQRAAVGVSSVE